MMKEDISERYDWSNGAHLNDREIEEEIQIMLQSKRRQTQIGRLLIVAVYKSDGSAEVLVSQDYHSRIYKPENNQI